MSLDDFPLPGNAQQVQPLGAPIEGIELWFATLTANDDEYARLASWLAPPEHARAARFGRESLRRRYIIGRALLRALLGRTLSLAPPAVPIVRGERGRPRLDGIGGIDFNVSHTDDVALIGIVRDEVRIGVDIERADREVNADGLARKFLTAPEQATLAPLAADERRVRFLRYWTCKEAMSKATGDGLAAPFRELVVNLDGGIDLRRGRAPYHPFRWRLSEIDVPRAHIATMAIWSCYVLSK
jgi:4'-phosphopantetheinyl transferase